MKRERLGKNLVIVAGVVKCRIKRKNKFHEWTAPYQGNHAYSNGAGGVKSPKPALLRWLSTLELSIAEKRWDAIQSTHITRGTASIADVIREYAIAAERRRAVSGVPSALSVRMSIGRLKQIVKAVGLSETNPVNSLTPAVIDKWLENRVRATTTEKRPRGKALSTAAAILNSARSVFSRWAMDDYRVNGVFIPDCITQWPRPTVTWKVQYVDPPLSLRQATLERSIELRRDNPKAWILFHVLLSFGTRPGDALRLTADNFQMHPGPNGSTRRYLIYRPHKTSNKNAKEVCQPVSERVWEELTATRNECREETPFIVPTVHGRRGRATVLEELNTWLRGIGWTKEFYKSAAYNLRGLFTSAVLNKYGEQVASDYCGSSVAMVRKHYGALYRDRLPEIDAAQVIGG